MSDSTPDPSTPDPSTPDGVTAFFLERQGELLRYAYALCGSREVAEDLVADAVARSIPHLRRGAVAQPRFYLRRAVLNAAIARSRRRAIESRTLDRLRAYFVEGRDIAEAVDERVEQQDLLGEALLSLPLPQRAAVVLRYLEDYSDEDVAKAMGTSVGTAKSRISRGTRALRRRLERTDPGASDRSAGESTP